MKKFLTTAIIIAIHAFILACLFFPTVRNMLSREKQPAPAPEVQPTPTEPPIAPPELPPAKPVEAPTAKPVEAPPAKPLEAPPAKPEKPLAEKPTTQTQQATSPNQPAQTEKPPVQPASNPPAAARPAVAAKLKPYHANYFRAALQPLPAKLAKSVEAVRAGVLVDVATHTILWERNSTDSYPIASLTKMLTAVMLLQRVEADPKLTMESTIQVTREDRDYIKKTPNMGHGVYLDQGESFTLREYLKCMIICSANDCAYIIGKFLGDGNLSTGIQRMNEKAKAMGMDDMLIYTPNGIPIDPPKGSRIENMASARDIAYLSECVMQQPEYMTWAGTKLDSIRQGDRRFDLASTNHLLRERFPGVNGLKTGYTKTAGYCIALSCTRDGRAMILVLLGAGNNDYGSFRDTIAKSLLDWAYQQPQPK